jgi:hypothetical protein
VIEREIPPPSLIAGYPDVPGPQARDVLICSFSF